ncbi:MAG TPA: ABC transporter substrate-binding protein [Mycobacteriales bacterium]|jgi:cellobiose transport system substrate-binding protein|nr:ABC transporter substrate-binding protein [Mycobacteriales bacterium]
MIRAGRRLRPRRTAALGLGLAAVLVAATGCGGDDSDAAGGGEGGQITLTVNVFGNFGYEDLYKEFQASHPNVKIVERGTGSDLSNYTPALTKNLAAGSGAGDVVALEEGIMIQFKEQAQNFADLGEYGGNDDRGNFLPWKFEGGQASDGKKLIGLGTDVGSMGMCYRRDLFQKAGLPVDREAVAKLWPDWASYVNVGNQFKGKNTGAKWFDAASNTYNTILVQTAGKSPGYTYFDRDNNLVVESNPAIKQAYDQMLGMIGQGLSAGYKSFSDQWNAGFKQGTFATIACPAWMLGYIQGQAGEANKGKWDVTSAPGEGGNWGGSWLAVPKQSKHPKEAAELVRFLTSPKGQIAAFKKVNNLPSSPVALDDPATKAFKNAYFNNAPVGEIFGTGAKELQPVYFGPRNQAVRDAVENTLLAVQQGKLKPEEAWARAVRDAQQAAK